MSKRILFAAMLVAGLAGAATASAAELVPRGNYQWRDRDAAFGGFSGLVMAPGGGSFYAVSDKGELYHARVARGGGGLIEEISIDWHDRLLDNRGGAVNAFTSDAEGLAPSPDGGLYVVYESYARANEIHPPDLHPKPLHKFDRFRDFWSNESFESVAAGPKGGLIIVAEKAEARTNAYVTFLRNGKSWRRGPPLPAGKGGFDASDATFGPDGRFYLLERRVSAGGFSTRVRRFAYRAGGFGPEETLLETAPGVLDNMEGMSLWIDATGRTIVSLISDDNFMFLQKTIVAEYELQESQ